MLAQLVSLLVLAAPACESPYQLKYGARECTAARSSRRGAAAAQAESAGSPRKPRIPGAVSAYAARKKGTIRARAQNLARARGGRFAQVPTRAEVPAGAARKSECV